MHFARPTVPCSPLPTPMGHQRGGERGSAAPHWLAIARVSSAAIACWRAARLLHREKSTLATRLALWNLWRTVGSR